MNDTKFYPYGTLFSLLGNTRAKYLLAQVAPLKGAFISMTDGNRWSDTPIELVWSGARGKSGLPADSQYLEYFTPSNVEDKAAPLTASSKPTVIEFFRYIRPRNPETGEIDPCRGLTLAVRLNYKHNMIEYGVSVCEGENFVKETGKDLAKLRLDNFLSAFYFTIPMLDDKVSADGVATMLATQIFELKSQYQVEGRRTSRSIAVDKIFNQMILA